MTRFRTLFYAGGGWVLAGVVLCLTAAYAGLRIQPPQKTPNNFALTDLHCWLYPCLLEQAHTPSGLAQRYGAAPVTEQIIKPSVSMNGTLVTTHGGRVILWTIDGEVQFTISTRGSVTALATTPEGNILTVTEHGELSLWTPEGELTKAFSLPVSLPITALTVSPDNRIAIASEDGEVSFWPLNGDKKNDIFDESDRPRLRTPNPIHAIRVSLDGTIVTASERGDVSIWTPDGVSKRTFSLRMLAPIAHVAIAPDGSLITVSEDGDVSFWSADGERKDADFSLEVFEPATAVAVAQNGIVAISSEDGEVIFSNPDGTVWNATYLDRPQPVGQIALTSLTVEVSYPDDPLTTEQMDEPNYERKLGLDSPTPIAVGLGPAGFIITAHYGHKALLWASNGDLVRQVPLPLRSAQLTAVSYGPKGTTAVGYIDGVVLILSPSGEEIRTFGMTMGSFPIALLHLEDGFLWATNQENSTFLLVGTVTAALWTWFVLVFACIGVLVFLFPLGIRIKYETDDGDQILESDRPEDDPRFITKSARDLSELIVGLIGNPRTYGPLTICLDGPWGSGKTSLITLLSRQLRQINCTCVYFDAWHHQNENHLFAALTEQIRRSWRPRVTATWPVSVGFSFSPTRIMLVWRDTVSFFIRICLRRLVRSPVPFLFYCGLLLLSTFVFLLLVLASSLRLLSPSVLESVLPSLDLATYPHVFLLITILSGSFALILYLWNGPGNVLKPFAAAPVSLISTSVGWFQFGQTLDQLSFRYRFQSSFNEVCNVLNVLGRRLVIVIDDLDRCDCDHIMEILEAVNFLTTSGSCFVILAMDEARVKEELTRRYCDSTESSAILFSPTNYLEKIINLTIEIPSTNPSELQDIRKG